jgi:hypothetical protein
MGAKNQSIGVVLLDFDQWSLTVRCLESLSNGSRQPDVIIIVENGSNSKFPNKKININNLSIVFLRPGVNLGCAGGRNLGLHYLFNNTHIKNFVVLDNDTVVTPDFIEYLAQWQLQPLQVLAPVIFDINRSSVWSAGGWVSSNGNITQINDVLNKNNINGYRVDWSPGACLIMSRCTWSLVGEFDSWLNFLYEDIEWCYRLRIAGGHINVIPSLIVFRFAVMQVSKIDIYKWILSELKLALFDAINGLLPWSLARVFGLASGLREGIRRRR